MEKNLYKAHIIGLLLIAFILVVSAEAQIQASKDNTLYENQTGAISNGSGAYFFAGRTAAQGGTAIRRGLIAFDIAGQIPEGATITSVTLTMRMSRSVAGNQSVGLYRLLADWGEGSSNATGQEGTGASAATNDATWIHTFFNSSFWSTAGGDFTASSSASQTVGGIGFYTWGSSTQMVNDVQNWLDNPQENFGWIVLGDESSGTTAKRFDSRENGTPANRPVLNVSFTTPNDPPTANNDPASTDEDTQAIIDILSNDSDSDGNVDPSTVTITGGPTNGTITNINSTNGNVTYDPDNDFNGDDSFTYTVEDNSGATSNEASVNITVLSVNDSPTAYNDTSGTNEDNSVIIDILSNDSDIDDGIDPSTVTVTSNPLNGSITNINTTNGNITYQPDNNYNGIDSFTYIVDDNSGASSNEATVNVTIKSVNDSPNALDDIANTEEEMNIVIDILENDSDIDGLLNPASVVVINQPEMGTIEGINTSSGSITYLPDDNFAGMDQFTYTVADDSGAVSNQATVSITINTVNDPPVFSEIPSIIFNEDDTYTGVLADFQEYVADPETPDSLLIYSFSQGNSVNVAFNYPQIIFTTVANWFGLDTLTIAVSDGEYSDSTQLYIIVKPVNDPPIFSDVPDSIEFSNDENYVLQLADYIIDEDIPSDSLRWKFGFSGENLDLEFSLETWILTLSAPEYQGLTTLIITVTDDSSESAADSVIVNVTDQISSLESFSTDSPVSYHIHQNYPNPFNPVTNIRFSIPKQSRVILTVYNTLGQQMGIILDKVIPAGTHSVTYDGQDLSSGVYFYSIQTEDFHRVMKMILLK